MAFLFTLANLLHLCLCLQHFFAETLWKPIGFCRRETGDSRGGRVGSVMEAGTRVFLSLPL